VARRAIYHCGAVVVNRPTVATDLTTFYAIGKPLIRDFMAPTALGKQLVLECIVFARSAAHHISEKRLPQVTL